MITLFLIAWFVKAVAAVLAVFAIHRVVKHGIYANKIPWKAKALAYTFLIGVVLTGATPLLKLQLNPLSESVSEIAHIIMGMGTIGVAIVLLSAKEANMKPVKEKRFDSGMNGSKPHPIMHHPV